MNDERETPLSPIGRVHIIGPSGSGKSTIARRLSRLINAPVQSLDKIAYADAHAGGYRQARSRGDRIKEVRSYCSGERWIAEGAYFQWLGGSFKHADIIIVLKVPADIRDRNLVNRHADNEDPEVLSRLRRASQEFDALLDSRIKSFLRPYQSKVKVFSSPRKVFKYFRRLPLGS